MISSSLTLRLSAVAVACGAFVQLASAQDATPVQDVLVQSGRLAQKQFDAPASIFTIDSKTIHDSGPQVNLSDTLSQAPGVVAFNRNNYAQDIQISIRGFGARATFGLRGIRLITDGIPATTPDGQGQASTVSLTSADRIEVLTGPLAQLYGNSSGGVIQTFTREAGAEPELNTQFFVGSFGMNRTDTQVSNRSGNVGVVADFSTFAIGGYRDNSDARRQQLNSVITADLKEDSRLKIVVNKFDSGYAKDPSGLTAAQVMADPKQAGTNTITDGARKIIAQEQYGLVFEHKFDADLNLSSRIYDGTRTNLQYQAASPTSSSPAKGTYVSLDRNFSGFGIQLNGKFKLDNSMKADWVAGFDEDRSNENRQGGATNLGVINTSSALTRNELDRAVNHDYLGQVNWHLSERWTAVTGVRKSDVQLNIANQLNASASGSGQTDYTATSPVLGLTWHASDTLNIYANQGRGFETPTLAETAYVGTTGAPAFGFNSNLQASHSLHREVGSKWTPTPMTRLDAAFFHITTENEIVTQISSTSGTSYTNAPQTLRQGFEAAWRQQLANNWRTQVSLTAMQATYSQGYSYKVLPPSGSSQTYAVNAGNNLPGVPTKQLYAALQWGEKGFTPAAQKPELGWGATLEWVARSTLWADDLNTASAAGYGVVNARVKDRFKVADATVETYLGVDNVGNKNYVGSVIVNQSNGLYFEPGLPRGWVLGVQGQIKF